MSGDFLPKPEIGKKDPRRSFSSVSFDSDLLGEGELGEEKKRGGG